MCVGGRVYPYPLVFLLAPDLRRNVESGRTPPPPAPVRMVLMSATAPPPPPKQPTVRLSRPVAGENLTSTTDYDLAPAVLAVPPVVPEHELNIRVRSGLDPETRALFRQRLLLCCLVASFPFAFFVACAATNFIDLFGRETVGWTGLVLSSAALAGLVGAAVYLSRRPHLSGDALRAMEVAIFGIMGLFFAYWQYQVLTAEPQTGFDGVRHERAAVLAAALIVHFNWFALIVFHGVLVPNTLSRGAGVATAMCAAALFVSTVAAVSHPPTRQNMVAVFAVSVTMLGAGSGLSVFGTAKQEALRHEVRVAREAVREMGNYRLRRKLGQGGMGEVYLAEHRLLKRPCALKRIHTRYLDNPEQVARFQREVGVTSQLRHPNTVEIYDYGEAADGTFFYVMEYLPGLSLEDVVARYGPLPPGRVVHILRQVCSALREAHRHGLVHRDIKPSNIVILPDGSPHDQAKVLDFGLVHLLFRGDVPPEKITREGLIVGTPEYMSPEQASGGTLDERSDLFSIGSVAYYLLTGREAFHREHPMKTLLAVVNDAPPPVAQYAPNAPWDLVAVVARCLTKLPEQRYERAGDLEHALALCECAADWTEENSAAWWATHRPVTIDLGTDLDGPPPIASGPSGVVRLSS